MPAVPASPVAKLYPTFMANLSKIAEHSGAACDAAHLTGQRTWHYPPTCSTPTQYQPQPGDPAVPAQPSITCWSLDPYDLVTMRGPFDRTDMNRDYIIVIKRFLPKQRLGEVMVIKLQLDYLAIMERAWRTRLASSVRLKIHSAARRCGHSLGSGPYLGTMVNWLNKLILAAFDDPGQEELFGVGRTTA